MNIILAGIMGRYPYGGVGWCSLMYLLGLRELGHRVWYLEDTGECNLDPVANTIALQPDYALGFIKSCLAPFSLGSCWCYIDYLGHYHGHTRDAWSRVCAEADLFLDLSGGCWFWREQYAAIPHSAFIDSDPGFTQLALAKKEPWYVEFLARFGRLFTFGRNIGTPTCAVPTQPFVWEHTWQPVCLRQWQPTESPPRGCFSTIMTWRIKSFEDIGGNKDQELARIVDLPRRVPIPLELALTGPLELLRAHGWHCRDAFPVSRTLDAYRDYIRSSRGEFSVAKHTYVRTNCGWFSDRTECYLASGRPAVVQDTGFSAHLPTGEGLIAYRTLEEAQAGLEAVQTDYERHARAAQEIARAHFATDVVLPRLLEQATAAPAACGAED
jgi:hypothetical protein